MVRTLCDWRYVSHRGCLKEMIADMNALSDAAEKAESIDKIKAAAQKTEASTEKVEMIKVTKS